MAARVFASGERRRSSDATHVKIRLLVAALAVLSLFGCQLVAGDFEIKESTPAKTGFCEAGEFRCNGEYLLTCTDDASDWMLDQICPTEDLCDSKLEQCRVCSIGDQRCDGVQRQECNEDGTAWNTVQECESDAMCNPTFCGNCTAGEFACRGTGETVDRELWECGAGNVWSMLLDTCATAGVCTSSLDMARTDPNWSKTCIQTVCDMPGAFRCEGQELQRCRQDLTGWDSIDTCASVALCEQGVQNATDSAGLVNMCPLGCLSPGMFVCEDQALTRCRDDLTGYDFVMACEPGTDCNPQQGSCSGPCSEGEFQCNGSQLRRCLADHTWEEVARCASPVLCITSFEGERATSGECIPPGCPTAGEFQCDGAALYECRQDLSSWETSATCDSAELCSAADKKCLPPVCLPGELQCFDAALGSDFASELRRCNASLTGWDVLETCAAGTFCSNDPADPGCKLECPSATRCNGAELERCTPNGWVHQANCATNELCSCTLNDSCTLGLFTDGCGTPVCGGTQAGYQCTGATLQKCSAGRNGWDTVQACGSTALCYPGAAPTFAAGYCATCPTAGEVRCATVGTGTRLETCAADRKTWNATQTCGAYGCMDAASMDYCAICNTGQVQCSAATLQRCGTERRSWVATACMSAALCDAAGNQCDVCETENSYWCTGTTTQVLHHCSSDGQQDQTQTCSNRCDAAGGECDACVPNTSRCSNNILLTCSANGQTEAMTTCATAALCNATAQRCDTPACAVGETRCAGTQPEIGAQPQICNANRTGWDNAGIPCTRAELCVAATGVCAPCTVGETRCLGAQPQICNANRTGWSNAGTECTTAALCVPATGVCAACTVGETRCAGTQPEIGAQPQICNANRTGWDNAGSACVDAALCVAATGECTAPTCAVGETRCSGDQPQICNANRNGWSNQGTACASGLCLAATGTCAACRANEMRCDGEQPQICNAERTAWENNGMVCARAGLCSSGVCTACVTGDTRCVDAQPQICNATRTGFQNNGTPCASAALCVPTTGMCMMPLCNGASWRCSGPNLQQCDTDMAGWTTIRNCGSPTLCDAAGMECDDCNPPAFQCLTTPNMLQQCTDTGHWMDLMDCLTGTCDPVAGMCIAPPPDPPAQ